MAAISQYEWHARWVHADAPGGLEEQVTVAKRVFEGCRALHQQILDEPAMTEEVKERGFVFDVFDNPTSAKLELIELNDSGARTGCGSCLFHWIRDARLLYGMQEDVEIRVAI